MYTREAIILAGGKGTRLKGVLDGIPKCMAAINGRPFLEYVLDYLGEYIFEHVVLSVGYEKEQIMEHFGNKYNDLEIEYAIEEEPLGTGGGIVHALEKIRGNRAFVINGDTMFRINLIRQFDFQQIKQTDFSIVLREVEDVSRYGAVEVNEDQQITGFFEKGEKKGPGLINGGVYLIHKRFFNKNSFPDTFSIEKDCFEALAHTGQFYGLKCKQYFIDIGIPEDLQKAQNDFKTFIH